MLARAPAVEEREPLPAYSPPDSCAAPVVPSFDAGEGVRDAQVGGLGPRPWSR